MFAYLQAHDVVGVVIHNQDVVILAVGFPGLDLFLIADVNCVNGLSQGIFLSEGLALEHFIIVYPDLERKLCSLILKFIFIF